LDEVTLLFVGDISFAGPIKYYVDHKYYTYNDTFNDVAPFIREADISVGNLESPFANQHVLNHLYRGRKPGIYCTCPIVILLDPPRRFAGFDVVTIANNHLNDLGGVGANFTTEVLEKTGIKYFGISLGKYDSSQEPLIIKRDRITIAFLRYCAIPSTKKNFSEMRKLFNSGPAIYQDDMATRDIRTLKKRRDIIVVFMHYGMETKLRPLPYQIDINKHLLSLGVDIIIGAHPHVVQGHCVKHNKLIEDSLGNFLFHPCPYKRGSNPVTYLSVRPVY
ncbi:unnamed protein product, partial [Pocillopora meandrina]